MKIITSNGLDENILDINPIKHLVKIGSLYYVDDFKVP
jgi:hypothetical protein